MHCQKKECEDELRSPIATFSKYITKKMQPESPCFQHNSEGVEIDWLKEAILEKL
jgi:hypothetical protein